MAEIKNLDYVQPRPISGQGMRKTIGNVAQGAANVGESVGSKIYNAMKPTTIGNAFLGASAGLANAMASDGSMRSKAPQQSAATFNQTLKDMGNDAVSGIKNLFSPSTPSSNPAQRITGGQKTGGGDGSNTNNAGNTGVITPKQVQSNIGQPISPSPISTIQSNISPPSSPNAPKAFGGTTTLTQSNGTLNINNGQGGTGSISFADGRQLSPERLGKLQANINYDSSPEQKERFARDAEVVAQRRADADKVRGEIADRRQREFYHGVIANEMGKGFVNHNLVNTAASALNAMDHNNQSDMAAQLKYITDNDRNQIVARKNLYDESRGADQLSLERQKNLAGVFGEANKNVWSPAQTLGAFHGAGIPVNKNVLAAAFAGNSDFANAKTVDDFTKIFEDENIPEGMRGYYWDLMNPES